ncbi:hypothetical protein F5B20DRAFT_578406 [Whalleya microplaca]|nr:hypothetical protein F5B20DRAFT_578406 [Whalleya microplaca]
MASDEVDMSKSSPRNRPLQQPSLPWRMTSSLVMGLTAALSRGFLYGLNSVEVVGLERFLDVLDSRKDVEKRQRGLVTVSNHVSVLDDPILWGVLPLRYAFNPSNFRWGLGAHDICFKNKLLGSFFYSGQVLPTHRLQHSPHGGLFQPTIPEAIRLLSSQPFTSPQPSSPPSPSPSPSPSPPSTASAPSLSHENDPFTAGSDSPPPNTYTTTGTDHYVAPSSYARNRHAWVHVFPEACVHQHPRLHLRYFKWGISRLILESEPAPDVLPLFVDGAQRLMPEDRRFPRFVPRAGTRFRVAFGELLDVEAAFGDLRARWRDLVRREEKGGGGSGVMGMGMGEGELSEELKYGREAVDLRIEVARRVREEVLKVRGVLGYRDGDEPGFERAETWARELDRERFRSNVDDSLVNKRK